MAKSPLTLQQLFTAENGLQWPDWAEIVIGGDRFVYFKGDGHMQTISGDFKSPPFGGNVLAIRQPKEACHIVEVNEMVSEWWDYEIHKAVNPAPVGTNLIVDCFDRGWKDAVVIGSFERWNWLDIAGVGLETVDLCRIKPLDHATRKAELERKALIEKAKAACFAPNSTPTITTIECLIDAGWRPKVEE